MSVQLEKKISSEEAKENLQTFATELNTSIQKLVYGAYGVKATTPTASTRREATLNRFWQFENGFRFGATVLGNAAGECPLVCRANLPVFNGQCLFGTRLKQRTRLDLCYHGRRLCLYRKCEYYCR